MFKAQPCGTRFAQNMLLYMLFLCLCHSKNGGGALSVTPVSVCMHLCVRLSVRYQIQIWYVDI